MALHTGNVQWRITQVAGLIDIDSRLKKDISGRQISPPNNNVQGVVAVDCTRVYVRKINLVKKRRLLHPREYVFYRFVHDFAFV
jgi:hypothetical protein